MLAVRSQQWPKQLGGVNMDRARPHSWTARLLEIVVVWVCAVPPARGGGIGLCDDLGGVCSEPCPCEGACFADENCSDGYICHAECVGPWDCYCYEPTGQWTCGPFCECAGRCIPTPEPTGPRGYSITDLGTLGGWSAHARAVNNLGQVVGEADTSAGYRHAFLWDHGVMTDLGVLEGHRVSFAVDINNYGQVACNSAYSGFCYDCWDAFLWSKGQKTELGHLGGHAAKAHAINDAGQIVGRATISGKIGHSFLWYDGTMTDLYTSIGVTDVHDINAFGDLTTAVAGEGGPHAAVWSNGKTSDLGTLGGLYSYAVGINDRGEVIGNSERAPGGDRLFFPFLWTDGKMVELEALYASFVNTASSALNNCGELVLGGQLYQPGQGLQDLSGMIPAEARWYELQTLGISDRGQIVGYGVFEGRYRAFLMSPVAGDLEVDGDIDFRDFAVFQNRFTGEKLPEIPGCERADLDGDADVDVDDLAVFYKALDGPR